MLIIGGVTPDINNHYDFDGFYGEQVSSEKYDDTALNYLSGDSSGYTITMNNGNIYSNISSVPTGTEVYSVWRLFETTTYNMFQFLNDKETIYENVIDGLPCSAYHADNGDGIYVLRPVSSENDWSSMLAATNDGNGVYDTSNAGLKMTPCSRDDYPGKDNYNIIEGSGSSYQITMNSTVLAAVYSAFPINGLSSVYYSVWRVFATDYCFTSATDQTNTKVALLQNSDAYDSLVVDAGLVDDSTAGNDEQVHKYYARRQITDTTYWTHLKNNGPETIGGVTYQLAGDAGFYTHTITGTEYYLDSVIPDALPSGNIYLILELKIHDYSVTQGILLATNTDTGVSSDSLLDSLASSASSMEFLAVSTVELTLTSAELLDNVSVASADLNTVLAGLTDAAAISAALGDTKTGMKETVATDLESVVAGLFGVTPSSTKVVTWTEDTLLPTLFTTEQMVDITTQLSTNNRGTLGDGFTLLEGDKIGVTVRIKKSETNYAEVNIFIQQT